MAAYLAEIIPYWSRHIDQPLEPAPRRFKSWYSRGSAEFIERFSLLVETLLANPSGARDLSNTVATIIVLDQFARKIYPKSAIAYAGHEPAAHIARSLLSHSEEQSLPIAQQLAVVMCLSNMESLDWHDVGLAWFDTHLVRVPIDQQPLLESFQALAERRREIVRLYGHLPARNQALGRASTPAEAYMMVGHGYEFE